MSQGVSRIRDDAILALRVRQLNGFGSLTVQIDHGRTPQQKTLLGHVSFQIGSVSIQIEVKLPLWLIPCTLQHTG